MDASTEPSLELLAITSPQEFVERFLTGLGYPAFFGYSRSSNGSRSSGATLESLYGKHAYPKDHGTVEDLSVKQVLREGGGEGEGESVCRVYAVVKDGVEIAYFATNGYYASEYGTDWDDVYTTVYPRQVVVTQYFTSKE